MALRPQDPGTDRPDESSQVVGDEGLLVFQEPDSGKWVYRKGGDESQTDINVGTASSPRDLIADGDYASGERNTGGSEAIAGEFSTDDGNSFNVEIDWIDEDGNVVETHDPNPGQDITGSFEFAWRIRSDRWELRVEDTSNAAQNNVHGSANVH